MIFNSHDGQPVALFTLMNKVCGEAMKLYIEV